jgi:hypothetical protein
MKTLTAITTALMLASSAQAETATSRALNACSKLSGTPYHTCLDRIPKCEALVVKDVDGWTKGTIISIDGGSEDPGMLCQHGGYCIPISAVRFKTSCRIVDQENENGSYYHWERGQ